MPNQAALTAPQHRDWRAELAERRSRGSAAARPGSLAGLAAARREHQGQFFTPSSVSALIWTLLAPAVAASTQSRLLNLLDTSCGTGSLFSGATPDRFTLAGLDVDAHAVDALVARAEAEGFETNFLVGSIADAAVSGFDVALINPPFSLTLSSANLKPCAATTFGRYGPDSSALSHSYALDQALAAARVVVAILPTSFAATLADREGAERLHAVLRLPQGAFRDENTEVDTSLAIFGPLLLPAEGTARGTIDAASAPEWGAQLASALAIATNVARPRLHLWGVAEERSITQPVTGDRRCRITRNGRRILLKFHCGLATAQGLNAVLREPVPVIENHRHPSARRALLATLEPRLYVGQGLLDVEVILAQEDPLATFGRLVDLLSAEALDVEVDAGLLSYLRRRVRRLAIEKTPLRRYVHSAGGGEDQVTATARRTHLEQPLDFRSTRVEQGQVLTFNRETSDTGGVIYRATLPNGRPYAVGDRDLRARFLVGEAPPEWRLTHPGRIEAHPDAAKKLMRRATAEKVDQFLTWTYQLGDAVEHAMVRGDINSWVMGLGKARLAAALCLLGGGRHNAVICPAHLVDELSEEFARLPIPRDSWQVLTRPDQALCRINIIAITRLRRPICNGAGRRTLATCLRRRFHTVVVDEAHSLKHATTDQTAATWALSPKRRYALTGSLINYARDALQVARWVAGDGTARQPFGIHAPYLEVNHAASMRYAVRGVDAFADKFLTFEWVTHTFREGLVTGGKREIPRLRSPEAYRDWLSPFLKRRVASEPEVAAHIRVPTFSTRVVEVPWDSDHFALYQEVAREFAQWYRQAQINAGRTGRQINMVTLLQRIGAVVQAANAPHREIGRFGGLPGLTSKHRAAIDYCLQWAGERQKHVVFAEQPDILDRIARALESHGLETVTYHGGIPIARRHRELRRFRQGSAVTLLASIGAAQTGLNLPQASRAIAVSRCWSAISEAQCLGRLLRPQQTQHVEGIYLELPGSIDCYQAQMCQWKLNSARVGIDDADSELDDQTFEHVDALLEAFVRSIEDQAAAA